MSGRMSRLRGVLPAALLTVAAQPAYAVFWTAPDPVVAGQPARAVFTTWSYGGQPEVEVQVEGQQIVLRQTNLCAPDICLSARIPALAEAALPPLEPGTYTVLLAWAGEDDPPVEAATLEVHAESSPLLLSAEGFWSPVGQPGSGLFLERRGNLLAVSAYSYQQDDSFWLLGAANYSGDSALLSLRGYRDGACLGCSEHRPPKALSGAVALQLRFESARRAWLDTVRLGAGATSLPITSLPYGAAYIPYTLTDTVDAEFGPLPLPDLRGRWIFSIEGSDAPAVAFPVALDDWMLDGEVVRFGSSVAVECRSATDTQRAGCTFRPGLLFSPPPAEPLRTFYDSGWFVPLGDIQEDRMRGVLEADGQAWRVRGFRTASPPTESP